MNEGWYKQHRNLFDREWAKDSKMVAVYVYLHCHAYAWQGNLHGQIIRRGSCPTSKPAIAEGTGLTIDEVKTRLRMLKDCGEIIVKPTNKGMIVTVCDYDGCNETEDLFGLNMPNGNTTQTPSENTTQYTPQNTPHIEYKKEDNKNSLISHFIPSKTERDKAKNMAYEIKAIYNKVFDGVLNKWQRLTDKMVAKVSICIGRFGRQSVDMVFEQIKYEHENMNKNGFVPDFDFIFKLEQYERYLNRYKLRISKKTAKAQPQPAEQKESTGSWLDAYNEDQEWRPEQKQ